MVIKQTPGNSLQNRFLLQTRKSSSMRGFTLIELIVVIGIIGILAAIGVPSYNGYLQNARNKDAQIALRTLAASQETYRLLSGGYYATPGSASTSSASCNTCCSPNQQNSASMAISLLKNTSLNTNYYYYCAYANNETSPPTFTVRAQNSSGTINFYINENGITSALGWSEASF